MDRRAFNRTVGVIGAGMISGLGSNELSGAESGTSPRGVASGSVVRTGAPGKRRGEIDVDRARRETP